MSDRPSGADAAPPASPLPGATEAGSSTGEAVPASGFWPTSEIAPDSVPYAPARPPATSEPLDSGIGFRTRLTIALIAAAVLPLASFGLVVVAAQKLLPNPTEAVPRVLLLSIAIAALLAVLVASPSPPT